MNDWQIVVLEELKAINRKLERLEDKLDNDIHFIDGKIDRLDKDIEKELAPIKKHVTQVKLISVLLSFIMPISITVYKLFI
jgi:hypothetical protein